MDISTIAQLVSTLGFPVVMCGAMAWFVKYSTDKNREEVSILNEQHTTEMNNVTEALQNNTLALQKLADIISMKGV